MGSLLEIPDPPDPETLSKWRVWLLSTWPTFVIGAAVAAFGIAGNAVATDNLPHIWLGLPKWGWVNAPTTWFVLAGALALIAHGGFSRRIAIGVKEGIHKAQPKLRELDRTSEFLTFVAGLSEHDQGLLEEIAAKGYALFREEHNALRGAIVHGDGAARMLIADAYRGAAAIWLGGRRPGGSAGPASGAKTPAVTTTSASGPRRLTSLQSAQIVQALNASTGTISICNSLAVHDADEFADDIAGAFRKAGWTVHRSSFMRLRVPPPTGIAIELPADGDWRPDPQIDSARLHKLMAGAIEAADLKADIRERTELWSQVHALLIVGRAPSDA